MSLFLFFLHSYILAAIQLTPKMHLFTSTLLILSLAFVPLVYSYDIEQSENSLVRLVRAANAKKQGTTISDDDDDVS